MSDFSNFRKTLFFVGFLGNLFGGNLRGASLETFHAAGGVNNLVVARIKRVAGAANFYVYFFLGRTNGKSITAGANNFGFGEIFWVDICFHIIRSI